MVVVVVEDFGLPEKSSNPTPPPPPPNGARPVESGVEPAGDAAAPSGSGEKDEFEKLIAPLGPIREPMLSRCWRAYLDSSAEAIAHLVGEALDGRNPPALFVWFIKRGEHRRYKPPPFTDAEIESLAAQIKAHRHVRYIRVVTECAHGCGETVCIDDGKAPILCLRCRRESGYEDAA